MVASGVATSARPEPIATWRSASGMAGENQIEGLNGGWLAGRGSQPVLPGGNGDRRCQAGRLAGSQKQAASKHA